MNTLKLPAIDLKDVCVPIEITKRVYLGPVDPDILSDLEQRGYDQAPVIDGGIYVGIVPTVQLQALMDAGVPLAIDNAELITRTVAAEAIQDVGDLLRVLTDQRAVLITDGVSENAPVQAMVTISDLNRHAIRKALYDPLSEVESRLATLLVHVLGDEEHALRHLGEVEQMQLLGHYHFMKRSGIELSLYAGAMLTQLLKVARQEPTVLNRLHYSKNNFKNATGSFPNLRNSIMHPVRPLIHRQEDVSQLLDRLERLVDLRMRLRTALDDFHGVPLL